ncbi:MAG TPA: peptidylprolyl isomerase [Tepidisphaeraceae bacterium]|nr:peptidylprolyl isomerase [Tepidisphaeraceae bacterium]
MQVAKDKVVEIDYTLTGDNGQVLDSSQGREPLAYLHGAGNIIPGLESALEGKNPGDQLNVQVPPDQAYGNRDERMVQAVPRNSFQGIQQIEPGMQFQANTPGGPRVITVVGVEGDQVTVDANHPLAGQTLNFDVKVVGIRDATDEERTHGHAHGAGGAQH